MISPFTNILADKKIYSIYDKIQHHTSHRLLGRRTRAHFRKHIISISDSNGTLIAKKMEKH